MNRLCGIVVTFALLAASAARGQDVPFLESPESVVETMLDLAAAI